MRKYMMELYQDSAKLWRWRLREASGRKRIIADSGEGYASKGNGKRAAKRLFEIVQGSYLTGREVHVTVNKG